MHSLESDGCTYLLNAAEDLVLKEDLRQSGTISFAIFGHGEKNGLMTTVHKWQCDFYWRQTDD